MERRPVRVVHFNPEPDPGVVPALLRALGHAHELVPCAALAGRWRAAPDDRVVLLGGIRSVIEPLDEELRATVTAVERWLEAGSAVFGICLGAQVVAFTLGARVRRHPQGVRKIGYHPVWAAGGAGRADSAGEGGSPFPAGTYYHWHYDVIEDLRDGEVTLAGAHTAVQAFARGPRVVGVQFHPEVTSATIERLTTVAGHRLASPGAQARADQLAGHARHAGPNRAALRRFLAGWAGGG